MISIVANVADALITVTPGPIRASRKSRTTSPKVALAFVTGGTSQSPCLCTLANMAFTRRGRPAGRGARGRVGDASEFAGTTADDVATKACSSADVVAR